MPTCLRCLGLHLPHLQGPVDPTYRPLAPTPIRREARSSPAAQSRALQQLRSLTWLTSSVKWVSALSQNPDLTFCAQVPETSNPGPLPPKDPSLAFSCQAPTLATSGPGAPSPLCSGTWALLPGHTWDTPIQRPWEPPCRGCAPVRSSSPVT